MFPIRGPNHFPGILSYVENMKSTGLIVSRLDNLRDLPESVIELTERGERVAEKLKEVEKLLKGRKNGKI
ncbi:MAG: hypothetical protein ACYCSO_03010 [Cuniculiplasma sp.]